MKSNEPTPSNRGTSATVLRQAIDGCTAGAPRFDTRGAYHHQRGRCRPRAGRLILGPRDHGTEYGLTHPGDRRREAGCVGSVRSEPQYSYE
jgi:hypothetical protein